MVVAMALMTGYTESVQRKLLGSGALIVYPPADESSEAQQASLDALQTLEGVDAVTFAVFAQGTLMSEAVPQGVDVVCARSRARPRPLRWQRRAARAAAAEADRCESRAGARFAGCAARTRPAGAAGRGGRRPCTPDGLGVPPGVAATEVPDRSRSAVSSTPASRSSIAGMWWSIVRWFAASASSPVCSRSPSTTRIRSALSSAGPSKPLPRLIWCAIGASATPSCSTLCGCRSWCCFLVLGLIVVVSTFNVASTLMVLVR